MPANPAAKFTRPRAHIAVLTRKAYESRSVAVIPSSEAAYMNPSRILALRNGGRGYTFYTRSRVEDLVGRGEMRWCDKHHNGATFTEAAAATWQKTPSGPVATMQMKVGNKGRYVPARQRDEELVLA